MSVDPVNGEQFLGYVVWFLKTYLILILCTFSFGGLIAGSVAVFIARRIRPYKTIRTKKQNYDD